jgi:hypothetical protein
VARSKWLVTMIGKRLLMPMRMFIGRRLDPPILGSRACPNGFIPLYYCIITSLEIMHCNLLKAGNFVRRVASLTCFSVKQYNLIE